MIYLDNAATSFPKPNEVIYKTVDFIKNSCGNPGRSSHSLSIKTSEKIYETRENICKLLGIKDKSENVVFTQNTTYALNFALKCCIKSGSHILISDIEHNSVARPIFAMKNTHGISYDIFDSSDVVNSIEKLINKNTKYIVSTLSSNVTGFEIPLPILSKLAQKHSLFLIVDASQEIGHKEINLKKTPCDILCAPGHKSLFGFQGCGFIVFNNTEILGAPLIEGGSGNESISKNMPQHLPERYEAGTLPSPSIVSLNEGINFLNQVTISEIYRHINKLTSELYARFSEIRDINLYGFDNGILSINVDKMDSNFLAEKLDELNICTRSGLHCAPMAHKVLGTLNSGTLRISFSYMNTYDDVDKVYYAVKSIINSYK